MPELGLPPYSYRSDSDVPDFDDSKPLFLFDGVCVLCSSGAGFLMRHDRRGRINLASAQSPLGQALYRHFGMALDDSYLFIEGGRAFTKSTGYFRAAQALGGLWRAVWIFWIVPRRVRDWLYDRVAANRYQWFGKAEYCSLLTPEQRTRLIA
jgi:predicted DCC family thiol-disulfide oxidoreductase YuxK